MATTQSTEAHPTPLPAGDWHVVPARSELGFRTAILFGLIPVRGQFSGFEGQLHLDATGQADGVLQVEVATIGTGIKRRDAHLRSKDFFHADVHPHLRFELAGLAPDAEGGWRLTGRLHIRDRALQIDTPVSVTEAGADELRIDADLEVDHRASGFEFKRLPRTVRAQASLTLERTG